MMRSSIPLLAVGAVLTLSACGTGGTGGSDGSAHETPGASADQPTTECVVDTWELDTADAANVMLQFLTGLGSPVTDARADGPVVMQIHGDGTMDYRTGVTYDFTATTDGLDMEVMQSQTGSAHGEWGWAGSSNTVMDFSGWTSNVTVTNAVQVGGVATDVPIDLPDSGPGSTPFTVTCAGDILTTKADAAPFGLTWHRG